MPCRCRVFLPFQEISLRISSYRRHFHGLVLQAQKAKAASRPLFTNASTAFGSLSAPSSFRSSKCGSDCTSSSVRSSAFSSTFSAAMSRHWNPSPWHRPSHLNLGLRDPVKSTAHGTKLNSSFLLSQPVSFGPRCSSLCVSKLMPFNLYGSYPAGHRTPSTPQTSSFSAFDFLHSLRAWASPSKL